MHRVFSIWVWATVICLIAICTKPAPLHATPAAPQKKEQSANRQVIAVFIDDMSFADLDVLRHYPHVHKWLNQAYYAAMTIRTPGARSRANGYLLLGSGGSALYTERSGTVYQRGEMANLAGVERQVTAWELMAQMRGSRLSSGSSSPQLLFPGIYRLHAHNADQPFTARIGLLGSALQEAGIGVSLYGNGDTSAGKERHAALFAINRDGEIPNGDVTERTTRKVTDYPDGIRSHYGYILDRIERDQSGLIVVQVADLARLYRLRDYLAPEHYQRQYHKVMTDLDRFLGQLLARRTSDQMLLVTSPAVNPVAAHEKSLLTPLMIWKGSAGGGQLLSATTRQEGVVSGLDVLPTILSWLSVPIPEGLAGHVMTVTQTEKVLSASVSQQGQSVGANMDDTQGIRGQGAGMDMGSQSGNRSPFSSFLDKVAQIDRIYQNRPSIMYTYVMLQIAILLAAALVWVWHKDGRRPPLNRVRRAVRLALLAMLFFPALFLLEPLLSWRVPSPVIVLVVVMFAFGGALLVRQWRLPRLLLAVAGFTVGCILLDGFTGGEAMRRSYMGYDPVIGARFYGLGNEYQGVLIGASILAVSSLYEWRKQKRPQDSRGMPFLLTLAGFVLTLYYMAAPTLGTNAGGFLAGSVGFGVALCRLEGWRVGKKGLFLLGGGLFVGILLLIVLHLGSDHPQTHVGRVAADIVNGNWRSVYQIVERKIEMNLRLIRVSSWSKVFVVSLVVIGLLSLRPDRYLRRLSQRHPYLVRGFSGVIAGSVAGLALNDSGIVSAATSIIFFVVPALVAALGEEEVRPSADPVDS
ncbi:MAG: hypothetical protein H0Z34_10175 [Brevibacillus sp.]|nr:hypothetical protein [Brevibacillus sp.]